MKMLLVEVPEVKVTYEIDGEEAVFSAVRTDYPKQSQLIVAGFLKEHVDIEIIDMKINDSDREELYKEFNYGNGKIRCYRKGMSFDSVEDKIRESEILGLTSNFTRSSSIVLDFVRYARSVNSDIKIIIGGSDATARYRYYLKNGVDIVVLGEGERITPRVIESIKRGKSFTELSGIAYKDGDKIIYNRRIESKDMVMADEIPLPAFDLVEIDKYVEAIEGPLPSVVSTPLGILETSRGCTHRCPFCTTPFLRVRYRYMSNKRIEELLNYYKDFGIMTLSLMEDNILARIAVRDRQSILDMFDMLKEYGFAWEFGNGLEIGRLMDDDGKIDYELIERLFYNGIKDGKFVGAYRLYVPLESLHNNPSTVYDKLKPYEKELEIIKTIASTGIPMMTFGIIIGVYDDTDETLRLTEKRCLEIKEIVEGMGIKTFFTPYLNVLLPGTPNYKHYRDQLKYDMEKYPELFHFHTATMKTKEFEPEKLTILKRKMEERINGKNAVKFWGSTGKYYFKRTNIRRYTKTRQVPLYKGA